MDALTYVTDYRKFGFLPIPLSPHLKRPLKDSVLSNVKIDCEFRANYNIGLFLNYPYGFVVADADDQQSQETISSKLQDLGLYQTTTIVRTPSRGGLHFWFKVKGMPSSIQPFYRLPSNIGHGEFRLCRNAYVVAPGSTLENGEYTFYQGDLESYTGQPVVEWKDLSWLLPEDRSIYKNGPNEDLLSLPINLQYRPNPKILKGLPILRTAKKGEKIILGTSDTGELIGTYQSRSEAEFAVVIGLIRSGWSFDEIYDAFEEEQSGHYAENSDPIGYLKRSYNNAIRKLSNNELSEQITQAYEITRNKPFAGRGGEYEQRVFEALLAKGWQFDTYSPSISLREISEYTAINSNTTVRAVLGRLQKQGFIKLLPTDEGETTQVDIEDYVKSVNNCNINPPPVNNVSVIDTNYKDVKEIWGRSYLGGSAKLVYSHLSDSMEQTISDLMKKTGKCRNTVKNALENKLFEYALAIKTNKCWKRGERSLADVAIEIEAKKLRIMREEKHAKEREYRARQNLFTKS